MQIYIFNNQEGRYNRRVKTSRQQVLEYVQAHRPVTAGELAEALHMSGANARHHLTILQEVGLVEVIGERPVKGKGRPTQLFGPAQGWLGDNLGLLADVLLAEFVPLEPVSPEKTAEAQATPGSTVTPGKEALARLARRLVAQMLSAENTPLIHPGGAASSPHHLSRRLVGVVQILNRFHYLARWEARAEAPRLIISNCPYAAIIDDHPELCQVDAELFAHLLEAQVERISARLPDRRGLPQCIFRLKAVQPSFL